MYQPDTDRTEYWLRGPVPLIPASLQPAAHALLQVRKELNEALAEFPSSLLWLDLYGTASAGFHLQHIRGVLDRLFTYARGHSLSEIQLQQLKLEGESYAGNETTTELLDQLNVQIELSLEFLAALDDKDATAIAYVGRARIPSTLLGILFHAAEHSMRHTGQLLVTAKAVRALADRGR